MTEAPKPTDQPQETLDAPMRSADDARSPNAVSRPRRVGGWLGGLGLIVVLIATLAFDGFTGPLTAGAEARGPAPTAPAASTPPASPSAAALATSPPTTSASAPSPSASAPTPSASVPAPSGIADGYLLMPKDELMGLPTSGPAWHSLVDVADGRWGVANICRQNVKHGAMALAGALVYARTGDETYWRKTRDAVMSVIGTERDACSILSIGRQLGSYVLAADFIGLSGADDDRFRDWLAAMRDSTFTGHSRWQQLVATHEDSANNWGAFAGASRIAASLYLGDLDDVDKAAQVLRGFLGDRTSWDQFRGQGSKNQLLESTVREWACDDSADGFVPVNPPCRAHGVDLDGAIVSDVSRDGQGLIWPVGPTGIGYTLESLQGLILQTELLYRNGYADAWNWSDDALRRVADLVTRNAHAGGPGWNRSSVTFHVPWLLNARYGLGLPTHPAGFGRIFGYTDWLYGPHST